MPTFVDRYLNTSSTAGGDGTTNATTGANRAWATMEEARAAMVTAYGSGYTGADVQVNLICSGTPDDTTAVGATWGSRAVPAEFHNLHVCTFFVTTTSTKERRRPAVG